MDNLDILTTDELREVLELKMKEEAIAKYRFPTKPSSDGYYHIYVPDPTRKKGRRAIKTRTIEELKERVYLHEKGIHGSVRKTFQDVFEIVQEQKLQYVKNPQKRISVNNTIARNRSEYVRFFRGTEFEKKHIDVITKKDIEDVMLMNLKRYDLRNKAFLSMRGIIKGVLDLAYNNYWIADNPYHRIAFKRYRDMIVPDVPVEERVHSDLDIQRILTEVKEREEKDPTYMPAYALHLQCLIGARRGELPPLMWTDIKEDHLYIHREQLIDCETRKNVIVDHVKNYQNRKFPRTRKVDELLGRLAAVHDQHYPESPYLFPADTENGCITNSTVYNYYHRICDKLGIEISRELTKGTHAFRRTRITEVATNPNGNIIIASKLFGNSPEVAAKNYFTGVNLAKARELLEG